MAPRRTKAKKTKAAAAKPTWEWAFLLPWFRELKGVVSIADEERIDTSPLDIGRDPEADWWLQIDWDYKLGDANAKRDALLRRRREALLLTSILADVDYDAWLKYLQKSCQLSAPRFVDLGSKRLRPKFRFIFDDDEDLGFQASDFGDGDGDDWDAGEERVENEAGSDNDDAAVKADDDDDSPNNQDADADSNSNSDSERETLHHPIEWDWCTASLFGIESFSNKFLKDYGRAMELVRKLGFQPNEGHAPRIQLCVHSSSRCPDNVAFLEDVERTLTNLQKIQQTGAPGFVLDSISLDMKFLDELMWTIPVLERIVELDIPIEELELPRHQSAHDHTPTRGVPTWPAVWASFLRALCGLSSGNSVRMARVSTVRIPPVAKIEPADMVALCSALLESRTVQHVQLVAQTPGIIMFGEGEVITAEIPASAWSWLALALFSKQSRTSIKSLTLKGYSLDENQVTAIEELVASEHPMAFLLRMLKDDVDTTRTDALTPISIPRGSKIAIVGEATSTPCAIPTDLEGLVVFSDVQDDAPYVFIAGYGLVVITMLARRTKRARTSTTTTTTSTTTPSIPPVPSDVRHKSSFQAFKIKSARGDTTSQTALPRLLDLIGRNLTSLRVKIPNVDEATADRMLRACPNLTHVTLANVSASSMKILEDAYVRGTPLSSLALKQWRVPSAELESFLTLLRDDESSVAGSLRRLRIGKRWPVAFPPSTFEIINSILLENRRLEHFAYYASYVADSDDELLKTFHGASVAGKGTPTPARSCRAFFEGVFYVATTNPRLALNDLVKANILAFAATPCRREVICWEDPLMGGRNSLMRFHQW